MGSSLRLDVDRTSRSYGRISRLKPTMSGVDSEARGRSALGQRPLQGYALVDGWSYSWRREPVKGRPTISPSPSAPPDAHRVVVVGSGFGGLFATRGLNGAPVQVTLIDRRTHHLFQPLLYQVATGILSQGDVAPATREILHRQRNARVVLGEVVNIDLDRRTVTSRLLGEETVSAYDSLIVAAGSTQFYFGHDEFAVHAPGLKSIDDALEVRGRIFGAFEVAELETDEQRRRAWMTFAVIGGGPTGVEMAGQIAELSRYSLRSNFRRIDTADARILLVDGAPRILGGFDERLSKRAAAKLERMGVEIRTGGLVTDGSGTGLELRNEAGTELIAAKEK